MRKLVFLTFGLLACATALAFTQPAEAGFFKHRGGGASCGCGESCDCAPVRHRLFGHRSGGGCQGYSGGGCVGTYSSGCAGGSGGCQGYSACSSCAGLTASPCANCPGGVQWTYAGGQSNVYGGTGIAQSNQFAVPDGQGGYKIVNSNGFHNGLPIVNPNDPAATAQQLPLPRTMPKPTNPPPQ